MIFRPFCVTSISPTLKQMADLVRQLTPRQTSELLVKLLDAHPSLMGFCISNIPHLPDQSLTFAISNPPPPTEKIDRRRKVITKKKENDPAFWDVQQLKDYIDKHGLHHRLPDTGRGTNGKLVKPDYLYVVRQYKKENFPRKRSRSDVSSSG